MPSLIRAILVVRCVLRSAEDNILLLQRSNERKNNPGKWELPGGQVDVGELPFDALRREVSEETGITIGQVANACIFDHHRMIEDGDLAGVLHSSLFYQAWVKTQEVSLSSEHHQSAWVPISRIRHFSLAQATADAIRACR